MADETIPSGLWQETRRTVEAWELARAHRKVGDLKEPSLAEIGQVLILPELGEPRVAWAVLRRGEAGARRLFVATDINPLVGSGDVPVHEAEVGALTLRCRHVAWVNASGLGPAEWLGSLSLEAVARAEARRAEIETGRPCGTFSEQETDEDPEYQDWMEEVIRPALAKLEEQSGADLTSPLPIPFPTPRPKPQPAPLPAWMRWAAVFAFLLLGAGSFFFWRRQGEEIAGLRAAQATREAAYRESIAKLEARRTEIEAQYRVRLKEAEKNRAQLEAEHRERLADLNAEIENLRRATDVKNPLLAALEPQSVRGTKRLEVGPEVSHLVLLLPVDDPEGTKFQVEVYSQPSGEKVFAQKGLEADILGEVRLGLPASLLPPGDYRLRLLRGEGSRPQLIREHEIVIQRPARRRPAR